MKKALIIAATLAALPLFGCEEQNSTTTRPVAADNTANNQNQPITATDQKNDRSSTDTAANVRSAVVKEFGSLSKPANVKIIVASDGTIRLAGVVDTQAQKDRIGEIANLYRGSNTVVNDLEVKGADNSLRAEPTTRPSAMMTPPDTMMPSSPSLMSSDAATTEPASR